MYTVAYSEDHGGLEMRAASIPGNDRRCIQYPFLCVSLDSEHSMLPSALLSFLSRCLSLFSSVSDVKPKELSFHLRHIHAHAGARVFFADVPPQARLVSHFADADSGLDGNNASSNDVYTLRTRRRKAHRPRSHAAFLDARRRSMLHAESAELLWDEEGVEGPDVEDRETLRFLAKMTYNAYVRLFV